MFVNSGSGIAPFVNILRRRHAAFGKVLTLTDLHILPHFYKYENFSQICPLPPTPLHLEWLAKEMYKFAGEPIYQAGGGGLGARSPVRVDITQHWPEYRPWERRIFRNIPTSEIARILLVHLERFLHGIFSLFWDSPGNGSLFARTHLKSRAIQEYSHNKDRNLHKTGSFQEYPHRIRLLPGYKWNS